MFTFSKKKYLIGLFPNLNITVTVIIYYLYKSYGSHYFSHGKNPVDLPLSKLKTILTFFKNIVKAFKDSSIQTENYVHGMFFLIFRVLLRHQDFDQMYDLLYSYAQKYMCMNSQVPLNVV